MKKITYALTVKIRRFMCESGESDDRATKELLILLSYMRSD